MIAVIARRLLSVIPTMLAASAIIFCLLRVVPGDPVDALALEGGISPERAAMLRQEMGLTLPLPLQYLHWIGTAATGDLGVSLRSDFKVGWLIWQALPRTAALAAYAIGIGLLIGVPLAFAAVAWPRSIFAGQATAIFTSPWPYRASPSPSAACWCSQSGCGGCRPPSTSCYRQRCSGWTSPAR